MLKTTIGYNCRQTANTCWN